MGDELKISEQPGQQPSSFTATTPESSAGRSSRDRVHEMDFCTSTDPRFLHHNSKMQKLLVFS